MNNWHRNLLKTLVKTQTRWATFQHILSPFTENAFVICLHIYNKYKLRCWKVRSTANFYCYVHHELRVLRVICVFSMWNRFCLRHMTFSFNVKSSSDLYLLLFSFRMMRLCPAIEVMTENIQFLNEMTVEWIFFKD